MTERKIVLNALMWTLFGHTSQKIIRLASNLILTRLLFPDLFGLVAIIYIVISLVAMMTDMGVGPFIIQNKEYNSEDTLNTAWTIQILRGIVVWFVIGILCLLLYYIQTYEIVPLSETYQDTRLPFLIFIAGFSVIITGFNSISVYTVDRSLKLKRLEIIRFFCRLFSIVLMVSYAYINPTIWALIYGALANSLFFMMSSHVFLPQNSHKICWNKKIVKKILSFGKWIMLSTMMSVAIMHGDKLILGGYISSSQLGFYSIALLFIDAVKSLFSTLAGRVWFPLFSKIKRRSVSDIGGTYYKIRFYQDALSYVFAGILFILAPLIIDFLYDDRYTNVGYIFSILSLSIAGVSIETIGFIFISMDRPKVASIINLARAVFLWVGLYLSLKYYDFFIALWVISLNFILVMPIGWFYLRKHRILVWYKELWTLPFFMVGYYLGEFFNMLSKYLI